MKAASKKSTFRFHQNSGRDARACASGNGSEHLGDGDVRVDADGSSDRGLAIRGRDDQGGRGLGVGRRIPDGDANVRVHADDSVPRLDLRRRYLNRRNFPLLPPDDDGRVHDHRPNAHRT